MNINKVLTATATSVATLAMAAPGFAATVNISGNGSNSYNRVRLRMSQRHMTEQVNETVNQNEVVVETNTGGNKANDNTGSRVNVTTGDTDTTVTVGNAGSANSLMGDDCGCENSSEDVNVYVADNGTRSDNIVSHRTRFSNRRSQLNFFSNLNGIGLFSNTGDNRTEGNTGEDGHVTVETGDETVDVLIENVGATNEL